MSPRYAIRLRGRQPCKELIHKPDVRAVCQMCLRRFVLLQLGESKWSTVAGFTGEDRFHSTSLAKSNKNRGSWERRIGMKEGRWEMMINNDHYRRAFKGEKKLTVLTICSCYKIFYWVCIWEENDFLCSPLQFGFSFSEEVWSNPQYIISETYGICDMTDCCFDTISTHPVTQLLDILSF